MYVTLDFIHNRFVKLWGTRTKVEFLHRHLQMFFAMNFEFTDGEDFIFDIAYANDLDSQIAS